MHSVTPDIGTTFQPIEDVLCDAFLPDLFKGGISHIPGRAVTGMPSKQSGIDIPDPTQTDGAKWTVSCVLTGHLVAELCRTDEFRSGDHALLIREGSDEIQRRLSETADTALGDTWAAASTKDACQMGRITRMGE